MAKLIMNSKKNNIKIKRNLMSAVFLLSAGKASHMKPRNRIDLIMLVYKSKIKHLTNQPNNMTISINKISWKNLKDIFMYDLNLSIYIKIRCHNNGEA